MELKYTVLSPISDDETLLKQIRGAFDIVRLRRNEGLVTRTFAELFPQIQTLSVDYSPVSLTELCYFVEEANGKRFRYVYPVDCEISSPFVRTDIQELKAIFAKYYYRARSMPNINFLFADCLKSQNNPFTPNELVDALRNNYNMNYIALTY